MLPRETNSIVLHWASRARASGGARAFYVAGSIASGDYVVGRSDFDLVALVESSLTSNQTANLVREHRELVRREPLANKLHCVYVPIDEVDDASVEHLTWAHQELFRRPLSGIARAEVLRFGVTVFGPAPEQLLPPVSADALKAAVRAELTGYWTAALGKPELWLQDVYVDLGLLVLARAHAALEDGRLITKREALTLLAMLGVPERLAAEVASRRYGTPPAITEDERRQRAAAVRAILSAGVTRLTGGRAHCG
jgi:hypothetical protein